MRAAVAALPVEPDWYKDAVIYELHVRAFADSDGDGRGDFRGLASRLDYLQRLGVTALWLLPFYPSPLRDDGYDIADYTAIHPELGTLADFRHFVSEAHRRQIRVITELVLNHTSDQHPWFQRSRAGKPGSHWRNFYVWSDTPDRYSDARVIFQDFEQSNWSYDNTAGAYYWHRFYSHQPDLNFRYPPVRSAMLRTVDFWLALGVDGLRLDAMPYLYEQEGTDCENLPETHEFLRALRRHVDERFPGRMLLAEANQWPEDASAYFGAGDGDECHMAFHFPLMPRLFMGVRMEDRFPILDIIQQTPAIPSSSQWALFLRNHDELTLEMVTDEERDYMYRAYAQDPAMRVNLGIRRRLAPLLEYHRQKIELMHGLLLSLPGTPVLYYGDEIGMGDNVFLGDRNGVRTPMQWSGDRNAGFSEANPHRLFLPVNIDPECHYESVNVAAQLANPDSLLRWVRRLVALRRRHRVFGRGQMDVVQSENPSVLAFVRDDEHEQVLVVANLSRFAQYVELDLAAFRGVTPLEMFGQTSFPAIGELPYLVTLSPYGFYWFELPRLRSEDAPAERALPELRVPVEWWRVLEGRARRSFEAALPAILQTRRWFGGKHRRVHSATIHDRVPLAGHGPRVELLVVNVEYFEGEHERYVLPVAMLSARDGEELERDHPDGLLARVTTPQGNAGVLVDAHYIADFGRTLLGLVERHRRRPGMGETRLVGTSMPGARTVLGEIGLDSKLPARVGGSEQSNTSIVLGRGDGPRAVLKSLRRVEPGPNPEVEIGRKLLGSRAHAARLLGTVELDSARGPGTTIATVHEFVAHESDGWTSTLRSVGAFFEQVVPAGDGPVLPAPPPGGMLDTGRAPTLDPGAAACLAEVAASAELLGRRTAELHVAIAAGDDEGFRPEPVTAMSQRSTYQSMRTSARRSLALLRQRVRHLDEHQQELASGILDREDELLERIAEVLSVRSGARVRVHGDLHLGQVLSTGRDYVFVDFEGEPARSFGERRLRRSVLADVAGMLRSYHYAAHTGIAELERRGGLDASGERPGSHAIPRYRDAADRWTFWAGACFLRGYLATETVHALLPGTGAEMAAALRAHLVDKALYELRYEIGSRPEWVHLPLYGLRFVLDDPGERGQ
ncbi:MAG TPA: maltose alpha-D-glucosyltransferase [Acidimicrobiales bacterium]|nr:maltose alpha-D-glucosyltransferase [Acidimicrobiales bacterium]